MMDNPFPPFVMDSETSRDAAESMISHSPGLRHLIAAEFLRAGVRGFTNDELEAKLGIKHQTLSARVRELVLDRTVMETERTRLTRSGRKAVVKVHWEWR
jgi:predicted transcriptional regulator